MADEVTVTVWVLRMVSMRACASSMTTTWLCVWFAVSITDQATLGALFERDTEGVSRRFGEEHLIRQGNELRGVSTYVGAAVQDVYLSLPYRPPGAVVRANFARATQVLEVFDRVDAGL
jgi:hypothetical protein